MYWILMNLVFGFLGEGPTSFISVFLYKQIMIQNFSFYDLYVNMNFQLPIDFEFELFW